MKTVPATSAAPQQQAYTRAYRDVTAHVELDEAFAKLRAVAESHAGLLQKQAAVRVRNWLKKLSEETANVVWKRNRNAYARLLVEQLRCGKLVEPFTGQPPGGPLPTLPKHLAYVFKPPRSSPAAPAATATAAAHSPGTAHAASALQVAQVATQQALSQQARSLGTQQQALLSASEQLDEYLGRADFRRAEAAEEEAAVASAFVPRDAVVADSLRAAGAGVSGGAAPQLLPGTRMQLRGAEGRRVDRRQLSDVGWQPSKLELEAQLGASRERQAELEWRLAAMETLLKQHSALLAPASIAAPLGSLLDAIDDGHVSPPRSKELDELIQRYDAKRRQWRSPAWAANGASSSVGGSPRRRPVQPPIEPSDKAEILQQLDAFQRQTETIRRVLGGGGGAGMDGDSSLTPRQLASSLAAAASEWGGPEGTPLRQHPFGLRDSGCTPGPGSRGPGIDLFEGLPPSPAALAARNWAQQQQQHGNRHVQHAGHHCCAPPQQQAVQAEAEAKGGEGATAPTQQRAQRERQQQQQQQQRPRSPIGPDVRHTKKSAAVAAVGASSALQRLKSRRPASAGAQAAEGQPLQPAAPSPQLSQLQPPSDGSPLPPQQQPQQQAAASLLLDSAISDLPMQQQPPQLRQHFAEAATSPLAPQLPPDSNAALVAEVRQLRSKLLQSLQKHAPELEAAGMGSSLLGGARSSAGTSKLQAPVRLEAQYEAEGSPSSSWRIAAGLGDASPPATTARSGGKFRLTDQSSLGVEAWAPGTGVASSSKYRLTDDGSVGGEFGRGRQRLSDLGGSFGGVGSLGGLGGGWAGTPASVLSGGGKTLARLGSQEAGGSGFSLEGFEAQTEVLRRQLANL